MHTLLAELTPGAFAILAIVGLMTCMLLVRTQKQMKAAKGSHHGAGGGHHAGHQRAKEETQATRQFEKWEVRMHDVARELSAQLDSKIMAVELLVREAQEQITRWERITAASGQVSAPSPDSIPPETPPAPHLGTQAAGLARLSPRPHLLGRNSSRRHQEVYALADSGQSSAAIAAQLGSPIGEVELILGLRRDQPAS